MDKGLSGSSVWQARWELAWGGMSKLHVFKIGPRRKLEREEKAVVDLASVIEPGFPLMRLYVHDGSDTALLRQEFMGDPFGTTVSLRQYIQDDDKCPDARTAANIVRRLYLSRMQAWHPQPREGHSNVFSRKVHCLADAIPWWSTKIKLHHSAREIGLAALDGSLASRFGTSVDELTRAVSGVATTTFTMDIGPAHGDLHAQNVNIDGRHNLYLIDFAATGLQWRAVDFLMLECALKFAASPPHAMLDDLLRLDDLIEIQWLRKTAFRCAELGGRIHGKGMEKIAAAICEVRKCARDLGAISSPEQYRMGLVFLTASLASINMLINRVFLFHSLAGQIQRLKSAA